MTQCIYKILQLTQITKSFLFSLQTVRMSRRKGRKSNTKIQVNGDLYVYDLKKSEESRV